MSQRKAGTPRGSDSSGLGKARRKHRATGNPKGGKRAGAGRPEGTANALPLGAVKVLKLARLLPENAPPELESIAGKAMHTLERVLDGELHYTDHSGYLKAAGMVLERVCGPVKQRVELSYDDVPDEQLEKKFRELLAKQTETPAAPELPSGEAGP